MTKRSERIIRRISLRNRSILIRKITSNFNIEGRVHVSRNTIERILFKYGLRSHRSFRSHLSLRKSRMEWARLKLHFDANKYSRRFQRRINVSDI